MERKSHPEGWLERFFWRYYLKNELQIHTNPQGLAEKWLLHDYKD
jgi:hypothetical protein